MSPAPDPPRPNLLEEIITTILEGGTGVVTGFEALTGSYLGQDWEIFGATPDDALVNFVRYRRRYLAASIEGFETLLASTMTEEELDRHWIYELHSGYDPRDDGFTYREWFAHALDVLRAEAAKQSE